MKPLIAHYPIYKQVFPDVLLIGVAHNDIDEVKSRGPIKLLRNKLSSLDHLAFEGDQEVHDINSDMGRVTYEQIALAHFKGQKHFLDEGFNYADILERHGVSAPLFVLLKEVYMLPGIGADSEPGHLLSDIRKSLQIGRDIYPGFDRVDIDSLLESFPRLIETFASDATLFENCFVAADTFNTYLARVRDHAIYGAGILDLRSGYEGQKGVIFGQSHFDYLKDLLKGGFERDYVHWAQYTPTLGRESQDAIRFLEGFAREYLE